MRWVKTRREYQGLSQRMLARRAGISYKTLQLIEAGKHDPRWSTVAKVIKALGLPIERLNAGMERYYGLKASTIAELSQRLLEDGEDWRQWLMEFVDEFRKKPSTETVLQPPDARLSPRLTALLASTVEYMCSEGRIAPPAWCLAAPSLETPWFVSELESLKASALVESPAQFRRRSIFTLGNFLERA